MPSPAWQTRSTTRAGSHGHGRSSTTWAERALVGVGHHEVRRAVLLADVVDPHDVVAVGAAQDPGLLEEPLADVDALRPVLGERLHGDVGAELVVAVEPHRREAAHPETVHATEATEALREGHARYCAARTIWPNRTGATWLTRRGRHRISRRSQIGRRPVTARRSTRCSPRSSRGCSASAGGCCSTPRTPRRPRRTRCCWWPPRSAASRAGRSSPPGCTRSPPTARGRRTAPSSDAPPSAPPTSCRPTPTRAPRA